VLLLPIIVTVSLRTADSAVMSSEEACNIALEYGFNPVVDDERSFDIYPE
jgi:hypothetical protein